MPARRPTRINMKKWSVHGCGWLSRDEACRKYGSPRIHVLTPWLTLTVALGTKDNSWCQMWFPWKVHNQWAEGGRSHYSDRIWSPIVIAPRR